MGAVAKGGAFMTDPRDDAEAVAIEALVAFLLDSAAKKGGS
jgi:hypothetical protein